MCVYMEKGGFIRTNTERLVSKSALPLHIFELNGFVFQLATLLLGLL